MAKGIVLYVENDEQADHVARLVSSVLALNGYDPGTAHLIDWPPTRDNEGRSDA